MLFLSAVMRPNVFFIAALLVLLCKQAGDGLGVGVNVNILKNRTWCFDIHHYVLLEGIIHNEESVE